MEQYGIIIVGTSVTPIIISLSYMWREGVDKIYLLCTENGSQQIVDKIISYYEERIIEKVIIHKYNINKIKNVVDEKIFNNFQKEEWIERKVYFDYTGGTKIQSAFLRDFIKNLEIENLDKDNEIYIHGNGGKINTSDEKPPRYRGIKAANDPKTIDLIAYIKGYEYNNEKYKIKNNKTGYEFQFDKIIMNGFRLEFYKTLENKLGANGIKNKGKVKLELFEALENASKIGEEFAIINIIVPDGLRKEYSDVLKDEIIGIKKVQYENRLRFIYKSEMEDI